MCGGVGARLLRSPAFPDLGFRVWGVVSRLLGIGAQDLRQTV